MTIHSTISFFRRADPRLWLLWAVLLGYILYPMLLVLGDSVWDPRAGLSLAPWREFVARGHWVFAARSVLVALGSVGLAGLIGISLAFLYFRLDFPGRPLFAGLTLLPFTLPPLVGTFAIWVLLGEDGPWAHLTRALLGRSLGFEKGYGGVLLVHVYSMFVYFYVLAGGALAALDEAQVEAVRDLGASRWQTFRHVILPQLRPPLAGAALLTFMTSMASFTAPFFYLAGRPVLTVGIQQAWEEGRAGLAAADCVVLAVSAGLFLWLAVRFEKTWTGGTRGAARRRIRVASPLGRWLLAGLALSLTLLLLAPHLEMLRQSLVRPGTGFIGVPIEYTVANYRALWRRPDMAGPIVNSLTASGLATAGVLAFALLSAWALARRFADNGGRATAKRSASLLSALVMLPWALPGTVVAIGLLRLTRAPNALTAGLELRGTIALLALAYFIRLVPLAHRTLLAGFTRVPAELEAAARDLGARPMQVFRRVTGPLLAPALAAAAALVFATAMGEFVSSILLAAPGDEPIAVRIDQLRRGPGGIHVAAAYSTVLLALIALTFILFGRRRNL